jgi:hypothetical protein
MTKHAAPLEWESRFQVATEPAVGRLTVFR